MAMTEWIHNWHKTGFAGICNADLFKEVDALVRSRIKAVTWKHVPAHSGEPGNEGADALAKRGAVNRDA